MTTTLNITEHATNDPCPRCSHELLQHVHCKTVGCTRFLVVCPSCDKRQAVEAYMRDHAKDCTPVAPRVLPVRLDEARAA